jgi:hypothetical protein
MGVTDAVPSDSVRRHVRYSLGRNWRELSPQSLFHAVAFSVRKRLVDAMLETGHALSRPTPSACTIFPWNS